MLRRLVLSLLVGVLALGGAAVPAVASGSADLFPQVGGVGPRVRRHPPVPCGARVADQRVRAGGRHPDPAPDAVHRVRGRGRADPHGVVVDRDRQRGHRHLEPRAWSRTPRRRRCRPSSTAPTGSAARRTGPTRRASSASSPRAPRSSPVRGRSTARRTPRATSPASTRRRRPACTAWRSTEPRGPSNAADGTPGPAPRPRRAASCAAAGSSINAWDITVRAAAEPASSVVDVPGRRVHVRARGLHGRQPAAGHDAAVPQHPRRLPLRGRHPRLRPQRLRLLRQPRGLPRRRRRRRR